jgi:hypothetical protein
MTSLVALSRHHFIVNTHLRKRKALADRLKTGVHVDILEQCPNDRTPAIRHKHYSKIRPRTYLLCTRWIRLA